MWQIWKISLNARWRQVNWWRIGELACSILRDAKENVAVNDQ
jgi:hypothetical protein